MALDSQQKAGLNRFLKQLKTDSRASQEIIAATESGDTETVHALLSELGFKEVFGYTSLDSVTDPAQVLTDFRQDLNKRMVRERDQAERAGKILDALEKNGYSPTEQKFWQGMFAAESNAATKQITKLITGLEQHYAPRGFISTADIKDVVSRRELDVTLVGPLAQELSARGIRVVQPLEPALIDVVRGSSSGVINLLQPEKVRANPDAKFSLTGNTRADIDLSKLGADTFRAAKQHFDSYGDKARAEKKAAMQLETYQNKTGAPISDVVVSYLLGRINQLRSSGEFDDMIVEELQREGLVEDEANQLLGRGAVTPSRPPLPPVGDDDVTRGGPVAPSPKPKPKPSPPQPSRDEVELRGWKPVEKALEQREFRKADSIVAGLQGPAARPVTPAANAIKAQFEQIKEAWVQGTVLLDHISTSDDIQLRILIAEQLLELDKGYQPAKDTLARLQPQLDDPQFRANFGPMHTLLKPEREAKTGEGPSYWMQVGVGTMIGAVGIALDFLADRFWGFGTFDFLPITVTLIVFFIMTCLAFWLARRSGFMRLIGALAILALYAVPGMSLVNFGQIKDGGTWFTSLAEVAVALMALKDIVTGRHNHIETAETWNEFVRRINARYFDGEATCIGYLDNFSDETSSDVTAEVHTIYPEMKKFRTSVRKTLQGLPPQHCWVALDGDRIVETYTGHDAPPLEAACG